MHHYENDVPFEVPAGWMWTTLGEIGNWQSGATPSRMQKEYYEGTIPWLKTGDLNDGLITEIPEKITEKALEETSLRLNPPGSVLIAMYGATIGKVGILTYPATTNQACCACIDYKINQMFLFYYLLANRKTFVSIGGGGAQPNISKEKIVSFPLPLPPLAEQERIVSEIERWFALIETIEQGKVNLQTAIKQMKSKVLDLAIHGKLVPQDASDEPASELLKRINPKAQSTCDNEHSRKLPYNWSCVSHNSIIELSGGSQPPKRKFISKPTKGYIRLFQIRDYGKNPLPVYIPNVDAVKQTHKGDILLARYGGSLGKVFIAENGAYNVAMTKVIFKQPQLIDKMFAFFYYHSRVYQDKLKEISRTAQAGFNSGDFEDLYFPLPPLAEQKRIVRKIEDLFTLINIIEMELAE